MSSSYAGLLGGQVHIGYHGDGCDGGQQQAVVLRGGRGYDGGCVASDLGGSLIHTARGQPSLSIVIPALLQCLADLSQTLQRPELHQNLLADSRRTSDDHISLHVFQHPAGTVH